MPYWYQPSSWARTHLDSLAIVDARRRKVLRDGLRRSFRARDVARRRDELALHDQVSGRTVLASGLEIDELLLTANRVLSRRRRAISCLRARASWPARAGWRLLAVMSAYTLRGLDCPSRRALFTRTVSEIQKVDQPRAAGRSVMLLPVVSR